METWQEWRKKKRLELLARREAVASSDRIQWSMGNNEFVGSWISNIMEKAPLDFTGRIVESTILALQ